MATKKQAKTRRTPLEEASDPNTDPKRLRQLADDEEVAGLVLRNPSVPEETWRKGLLDNWPEAWDNPMAPLYLIAWTPRPRDSQTLEEAAVRATYILLRDPTRCSTQGKVLLAAKVHEWWDTTEDINKMIHFLVMLARKKGIDSPIHRKVVGIAIACLRTSPRLTRKDKKALDLLQDWVVGEEDRREKALQLDSSEAVHDVVEFAQDTSYNVLSPIRQVLLDVAFGKKGAEREEAMAQHARKLAGILRREMPLPPGVE